MTMYNENKRIDSSQEKRVSNLPSLANSLPDQIERKGEVLGQGNLASNRNQNQSPKSNSMMDFTKHADEDDSPERHGVNFQTRGGKDGRESISMSIQSNRLSNTTGNPNMRYQYTESRLSEDEEIPDKLNSDESDQNNNEGGRPQMKEISEENNSLSVTESEATSKMQGERHTLPVNMGQNFDDINQIKETQSQINDRQVDGINSDSSSHGIP